MALVLKDRVKETTTTTGTGTYSLAGAVTGFEAFSEVGDGNTTYYACTDGTDFEVGIGTYTASGTTLARTTILQSSNADAAVSWSAGSKTIFITQPAEKAVFLNADGDIEFDSNHRIKVQSNGTDAVLDISGGGPNFIRFRPDSGFSNTADGVDIVYRTTPNDLLIERSQNANKIAEFGGDDGHAALYHNNSKKLETTSDGAEILSTDDGAGNEPILSLYRHSASPADQDHAGTIQFNFQNDADEKILGGRIYSEVDDVTDGSEDAAIKIAGLRGGSEQEYLELSFGLVQITGDSLLLPSGKTIRFEGSTNDANETTLTVADPTADRTITLPDRDGLIRVVDQQAMTSNLAVGWHTIAVFQGRDDSPQGSNQRFHAKFSLIDITSSRHQAMTFYAQSMFGQDEGLQVIGNSTFGTAVVRAIRIKSSTDSNGLYAGAAIQVYVGDATNNLVLYLDEANLDDGENGTSYGNVILKTGVADASDPGDVGYSTATWSTFAVDVQIAINSIEPGGIGVTGNLLTQSNIVLEGATADANETIITATDATADRTITLPDATGTVITTGNSDTPTTTTTAADADFVLVDDGGTMKKITPANLGITAGAASVDDATALAIALG